MNLNARSKIDIVEDEEDDKAYLEINKAKVLWPPNCSYTITSHAIEKATNLLKVHPVDTQGMKLAQNLKKSMDKTFGEYWHVVCGKHFGCFAIHEVRHFLFFYIENSAFLLYKAG